MKSHNNLNVAGDCQNTCKDGKKSNRGWTILGWKDLLEFGIEAIRSDEPDSKEFRLNSFRTGLRYPTVFTFILGVVQFRAHRIESHHSRVVWR